LNFVEPNPDHDRGSFHAIMLQNQGNHASFFFWIFSHFTLVYMQNSIKVVTGEGSQVSDHRALQHIVR